MAATYFYTHVSVQIAVYDPVLLQAARSNLFHLGCRDIAFTREIGVLGQRLGESYCDLLIIQADLEDVRKVARLISAVRHGDLGRNPFMPMVAVTNTATVDQVRALVDAGVDDVLPYPWSDSYVDTRLENLIHNRKPFVVTSDYVGPDRRQKPREGTRHPIESLPVPNSLRAKALDRVSNEKLEEQIQTMAVRVSQDKLLRLSELVVRLCGEMAAMEKARQYSPALAGASLNKLADATRSIIRRAADTPYAKRCANCNTLHRTVNVMQQAVKAEMEPELHLLEGLAERFAHDFGVSMDLFHNPLTKDVINKRIAAAQGAKGN
jgi:CheY-like chemotaxis protein